MSETTTEIETDQPRRRGRTPRPEREVHREPEVTIDQERPSGPSPEHVLADVNRQLQAKDQELATARQRAEAAEAARRQAEVRSQTDRKTVLGEAIAGAKAESEAASAAYRAAREAGDFDAEATALRRMNAADYRLNQATAELEMAKAEPATAPQPQPGGPQPWKPSAAAQRWMDDHPRLNTDPAYQRDALNLDKEAIANGCVSGSQAYVDYIERGMTRLYGDGHGQVGGQRMRNERGDGGSVSPAPSGGGDRVGGGRHVSYPIGDMQVRRKSDGSTSITLLASHGKSYDEVRRDYHEAAKTNFPKQYEQNPDATVGMYCQECIAIADDGFADLKIGDGRTLGTGSDSV